MKNTVTIRFTHPDGDQTFKSDATSPDIHENFANFASRAHCQDIGSLQFLYTYKGTRYEIIDSDSMDSFLRALDDAELVVQVETVDDYDMVEVQPQHTEKKSTTCVLESPAGPSPLTSVHLAVSTSPIKSKQVAIKVEGNTYDCLTHDVALDLEQLSSSILESNDAAKELRGKEVVAMVGPTGVGKTTFINWMINNKPLRESMETKELKDGSTIPVKVWNADKALAGFEMGHSAVDSTTKTCRAIFDERLGLHLLDLPGMFDSNGPAVDIANAVGVANALRACKSVRFLIVIDASGLKPGKGKAIKDLMEVLVRFIGADLAAFDSFTFLFTRETPPNEIVCVLKQLWNNAKEGSSFALLAKAMLTAIEQHPKKLMINQSIDTPHFIRDLLKQSKPLSTTDIKSPLTREDIHSLKLACQNKKALIEEYLRLRNNKPINYQEVSSELGILSHLAVGISEVFISEVLKESCNLTLTHLRNVLDQATANFAEKRFSTVHTELESLRQAECFLKSHDFDGFYQVFLGTKELYAVINAQACAVAGTAANQTTSLNAVCAALDIAREMGKHLHSVLMPITKETLMKAATVVGDRVLEVQSRVQLAVEGLSQPNIASASTSTSTHTSSDFKVDHNLPNLTSDNRNVSNTLELTCDRLASDLALLKDAKILSSHLLVRIPGLLELYQKGCDSIVAVLKIHTEETHNTVTVLRSSIQLVQNGFPTATAAANATLPGHGGPDTNNVKAKTFPNCNNLSATAALSNRLLVLKSVCQHRAGLSVHLNASNVDALSLFDIALGYLEKFGDELFASMDDYSVKSQFNLLAQPVDLCLALCGVSGDIHAALHEKTMHKLKNVLSLVTNLFNDFNEKLQRSKNTVGEANYELFLGLGKTARSVSLAVPLDKFLPPSSSLSSLELGDDTERKLSGTPIRTMHEKLVQELSNWFQVVLHACKETLSSPSANANVNVSLNSSGLDVSLIQHSLGDVDKFCYVHDLLQEEDIEELLNMLRSVHKRVEELKTQAGLLTQETPARPDTPKTPEGTANTKDANTNKKTKNLLHSPQHVQPNKQPNKHQGRNANLKQGSCKPELNDFKNEGKQLQSSASAYEVQFANTSLTTFKICLQERAILQAASVYLRQMKFGEVLPAWSQLLPGAEEFGCTDSYLIRFMMLQSQVKRKLFRKFSQDLEFRSMITVLEWFEDAAQCCGGKELGQDVVETLDEKDLRRACGEQVKTLLEECKSMIDQHDYDAAAKKLEVIEDSSVLQEYTLELGFDISSKQREMRTHLNGSKDTVTKSVCLELNKNRFDKVAAIIGKMKESEVKKAFESCDETVFDHLEKISEIVQSFAFDSKFSWESLRQLCNQIATLRAAKCLHGITTFDVISALEKAEDIFKGFFLKFSRKCLQFLNKRYYAMASEQWMIVQHFQNPGLNLSKDIRDLVGKTAVALVAKINGIDENLRHSLASAMCAERISSATPSALQLQSAETSKLDKDALQQSAPKLGDVQLCLSGEPQPEDVELIFDSVKEAIKKNAFLDSAGTGDQELSIDFRRLMGRLNQDAETYLNKIGEKVRNCLFENHLDDASKGIEILKQLKTVSTSKCAVYAGRGIESLITDLKTTKSTLSSALVAPSLTAEHAPGVAHDIAHTHRSEGAGAAKQKIIQIQEIFDSLAKEFDKDLLKCNQRNLESMAEIFRLWDAYIKAFTQHKQLDSVRNLFRRTYVNMQTDLLWEKIEFLMHMGPLGGSRVADARTAGVAGAADAAVGASDADVFPSSTLTHLKMVLSIFKDSPFPKAKERLGTLSKFIQTTEQAMTVGQKRLSDARLFFKKLNFAQDMDFKVFTTHAEAVCQHNRTRRGMFDMTDVLIQQVQSATETAIKSLNCQKSEAATPAAAAADSSYEATRFCLHNLNQLVRHTFVNNDLKDVCQKCGDQLKNEVLLCISSFHKRALLAVDLDNISDLEPIWREIDVMEVALKYEYNFSHSLSDELEGKIYEKIHTIIKEATLHNPSIHDVGSLLLRLQNYVREISKDTVKQKIRTEMGNLMQKLQDDKEWNNFALGQYLRSKGVVGLEIVRTVGVFEANRLQHFQSASGAVTVDDALKAMQEPKWADTNGHINATELRDLFGVFEERFENLTKEYLFEKCDAELMEKVKQEAAKLSKQSATQWSSIRKELVLLLAGVFAAWSVSKSATLYEKRPTGTPVFYKPHAVQVLTVFRLLGLDEGPSFSSKIGAALGMISQRLQNHLCQVITGGGKSVILGVLSTLLALLGFDVKCACYSKFLSVRDAKDFADLWTAFDVKKHIKYSTLDDLVEDAINQEGDIRAMTNSIVNNDHFNSGCSDSKTSRPCVLLIDEVDVFLTEQFYGKTYNPVTTFQSKSLTALAEYVWKNHTDKKAALNVQTLQNLPEYAVLKTELSAIRGFANHVLTDMLEDVASFPSHKYHLKNQNGTVCIGYLSDGGDICTSTSYGWLTVFAYLHERDHPSSGPTGPVTASTAASRTKANINCGQFSFAQIPKSKQFACILGVTGTLNTLGTFEKDVLKNVYNITNQTITPSIYGESRLDFKQNGPDVHVSLTREGDGWTQKLTGDILRRVKDERRSVMVFFKSEEQMHTYLDSSQGKQLMNHSPKPEVVKSGDPRIGHFVEQAPLKGRITLFHRVWGRGLDFSCDDDEVKNVGGVHVIQTFFSEDISEEVQIKGRTARSMDRGSYQLILCAEDLYEFKITDTELENLAKGVELYNTLDGLRTTKKNNLTVKRNKDVDSAKAAHDKAMQYVTALRQKPVQIARVKKLLCALNVQ